MWESIGSISTGEVPHDEDWIVFALGLARSYVLQTCGHPPDGCKLEIMWQDHDLGSYPTLGLWSEWGDSGDYFARAEAALNCFDDAIDWHRLKEHSLRSIDDDDDETEDSYGGLDDDEKRDEEA